MNQIMIDGFTRITKQTARKRHNAGLASYMLPCKMNPSNVWMKPVPVPVYTPQGATFSEIVNAFEYYNCNAETGRYTAFYIKEEYNQ